MAFVIKPLLGIGQIVLISAYDEAIDWEHSKVTIEEYVKNPLRHMTNLAFKPEMVPCKFRFRAPTETDRGEVDTTQMAVNEAGAVVQSRKPRKEMAALCRRCLEGIEGYVLDDGTVVKVELVPSPDGRQWASQATMDLIPYDAVCELGSHLATSQAMTDELKNG